MNNKQLNEHLKTIKYELNYAEKKHPKFCDCFDSLMGSCYKDIVEKILHQVRSINDSLTEENNIGAIPVVPKIYYKQNPQDPAKGADSVHIVIEPDNTFSLWLGEAKFYNSIENVRLDEIVKSVHSTCETPNIKKENSIITDIRDLDLIDMDESLRNQIKEFLKEDVSIDRIKPILHIPIMLLYECNLTKVQTDRSDEYVDNIVGDIETLLAAL